MKCPGQDTQYWNSDAIFEAKCSKCGVIIEFFKDDTSRRCKACGHRMVNPNMDFGCAAYCPFAEQCIGTLPEEFVQSRDSLFKDRVAVEMKRYFKTDFKRIGHTVRMARYTEEIGKAENANLAISLSAAYLYSIGMPVAEKKYGAQASEHRADEGRTVARTILEKLKAKEELVDAVLDIVGSNGSKKDGDINYKTVHDANLIATLEDQNKNNPLNESTLEETLKKSFLTPTGQTKAKQVLLPA